MPQNQRYVGSYCPLVDAINQKAAQGYRLNYELSEIT